MFSILIFIAFPRIEFIIVQTVIYGVVGGILYACVRVGLNYVFGRPVARKEEIMGSTERMNSGGAGAEQ